ncbi:MAG: TolC family protein [Sandaracinaceae bacterium]
MRQKMIAAGAAAWLVLASWPAAAQPAPAPDGLEADVPEVTLGGTPVSLAVLLAHAERRAPALAVAEAEVDLAQADFGVAEPLLPNNATLQVGVGPTNQASANGEYDVGAQVQLLQPFEIAGQRPLRFDVARAARATRERTLERARWRVHQQIHAGYRGALAARRQAEITRTLAAFATQLVDIAHRRVQAGDAAPLIERLAEADAADAQQRSVAAFQAYRDACLALAEIAGWPVASPPEPIGALPPPRRAPSLGALSQLAQAHNPELLVRRAAVEEAALRVDLAHRDAWPDPQLGFQYTYTATGGGGAPPQHTILAMFQIEIPSFALNQAEIARTSSQRGVAEARRDALSSMIEVRLERLRTAVNAAAERVESYGSDILPRFEENLTMLRRAFELGEIDLLRVSVALERFLTVQQQALGAHVDYFAAVAALEAQVGEEIWEDEGGER